MSGDVFVIAEHRDGAIIDTTYELLGRAKALAGASGGEAVAVLLGSAVAGLAGSLGAAARVIVVDGPGLASFSPSAYQAALVPLVRERQPALVLVANSGSGMDVAAGLSAAPDLPPAASRARPGRRRGRRAGARRSRPWFRRQLTSGSASSISSVRRQATLTSRARRSSCPSAGASASRRTWSWSRRSRPSSAARCPPPGRSPMPAGCRARARSASPA